MIHYWGAKAICDRIGYKGSGRLSDLIIRYHLPAYKRHDPKKKCILVYYSNEAMIGKWELARSQRIREQLLGKQEARAETRREQRRYGPRGIKK